MREGLKDRENRTVEFLSNKLQFYVSAAGQREKRRLKERWFIAVITYNKCMFYNVKHNK